MYGKSGDSGANSNGTVHCNGNFPENGNTFRGITFFSFLPKQPKFFVPFVWLTSARFPLEAKGDLFSPRPTCHLVFCTRTTLTHSSFRKRFQVQYHSSEIFYRNFLTNGKRSGLWDNTLENFFSHISSYSCACVRINYEKTKAQVPLHPL